MAQLQRRPTASAPSPQPDPPLANLYQRPIGRVLVESALAGGLEFLEAKRSRPKPTPRKKEQRRTPPLPRCRRLRGGGGLQEREPRGRFANCAARCKRDKEGGIPPTPYRAADGGCRAREAKRLRAVAGRRARRKTKVVPPNSTRVAMRGHGRGRSRAEPAKTRRVAQDCAPRLTWRLPSGRKDAQIAHFSQASTVAPTVTARCSVKHTHTPHTGTSHREAHSTL